MHGKTSKFAYTALSALLYTQAMLGFASVTVVVLKDRMQAAPIVSASADALQH